MDILNLIKGENKRRILKALKRFGEVQILAQELFAEVKSTTPDIMMTLTPTYLQKQDYDALNPIQRQFKELFEHREKLQIYLKDRDYPVLDRAIGIPSLNIEKAIALTNALDENDPYHNFISLQPQATVIITTENALPNTKKIISDMTNISIANMHEIPVDKCPVLFAGMTTPNKTRKLIADIDIYLQTIPCVEQKDDDWTLHA